MGWDELQWEEPDEEEMEGLDFEDGDVRLIDDEGPAAVCTLCHDDTYGEDYLCERCAGLLCRKCSVPAIDGYGNMVVLCTDCAEEHGYGKYRKIDADDN